MSYLRQRAFGLAYHFSIWHVCHLDCHSLVARTFGDYPRSMYWYISTYFTDEKSEHVFRGLVSPPPL